MKKAFMSLKFYEGDATKKKVEELTLALEQAGIENFVMIRDVEKYGEVEISNKSLMKDYAFPAMEKSDMLIVEFSEKGVGLGIGAGYAFAKNIPIYIIAKNGSEISSTIEGLAKKIIFYDEMQDITMAFKKIIKEEKNDRY